MSLFGPITIGYISDHLERLGALTDDLNEANDFVLGKKEPYKRVMVLVACWPDEVSEYPHIREDAQNLCWVFKHRYNFEVNEKPFQIPVNDSHYAFYEELRRVLLDLYVAEIGNHLFILYYGGCSAVDFEGRAVWRPKEYEYDAAQWRTADRDQIRERQNAVVWGDCLHLLNSAHYDILFLLDHCGPDSMVNHSRAPGQRCEVFSSLSTVQNVSNDPDWSFTKAITRELERLYQERKGCDIKRLHATLHLKNKRDEHRLKTEPYWADFTHPQQTSIFLAPLSGEAVSLETTPEDVAAVSDVRVFFKVEFETPDGPVNEEWKKFVRERSGNLTWRTHPEVIVHNLYHEERSTAIMSMPMMLWSSLPFSMRYKYICAVSSKDCLGDAVPVDDFMCDLPDDYLNWITDDEEMDDDEDHRSFT